MTLTPEQRAAIEAEHQAAKDYVSGGTFTYPLKQFAVDEKAAPFYKNAHKHVETLLEALRDVEAQRDEALDQVSMLATEIIKEAKQSIEFFPEHEKMYYSLKRLRGKALTFESTAQAHTARLRQEGRDEERARLLKAVFGLRNPYAGGDCGPYGFWQRCKLEVLDLFKEPTDAAEGGAE